MTVREFSIDSQNADATEADKAALRWRAIEAANSAPGLSAVARRVLVAMICAMDGRTRECYPSELWLASFLGVHLQSVKKAKAELRDEHKLINWENPGGPRHQSHYLFNWQKIIRLSDEAKTQARAAVEERRSRKPTYGSPQTTYQGPVIGSPQATLEPVIGSPQATMEADQGCSKVAYRLPQGSQIASQGSLQATPKVAPRLPDQPYINPIRTTQHNTPSAVAAAPDGRAPSSGGLHHPDTPHPVAGKVALEEGKPHCVRSFPYPKVLEAFEETDPLRTALLLMDADAAMTVSKLFATKGRDAAALYLGRAIA